MEMLLKTEEQRPVSSEQIYCSVNPMVCAAQLEKKKGIPQYAKNFSGLAVAMVPHVHMSMTLPLGKYAHIGI